MTAGNGASVPRRWLISRCAAPAVVALTISVTLLSFLIAEPDRTGGLSIILGVGAVLAGALAVVGAPDELSVSASFIVYVIAGAFLGPRSAVLAAVVSEAVASLRARTRPRTALLENLPASVLPALVAPLAVHVLASGHPTNRPSFYVAMVIAGAGSMTLSFCLWASLRGLFSPERQQFGFRTYIEDLPSTGLNVLLVVAGSAITLKLGNAGIAFALSAVFTFSYMAHLLNQSRKRAQQYVSLSWGVLGGLMRSLDIRDNRAARHAAAVASFARDIAQAVGMDERACELAHTAGLLHDIGRFALSDRVAERGRPLTDEDWAAIHRHPELGADTLRDLGMYGPVADIVHAHHERPDGRGYPLGLTADEIPEIAKIIAVAEVYDTLTASDTYRSPMSSLAALMELRRVSGSQLDGRYVEALASLLSGEDLRYRHADSADFDTELAMEERIRRAGAGG